MLHLLEIAARNKRLMDEEAEDSPDDYNKEDSSKGKKRARLQHLDEEELLLSNDIFGTSCFADGNETEESGEGNKDAENSAEDSNNETFLTNNNVCYLFSLYSILIIFIV